VLVERINYSRHRNQNTEEEITTIMDEEESEILSIIKDEESERVTKTMYEESERVNTITDEEESETPDRKFKTPARRSCCWLIVVLVVIVTSVAIPAILVKSMLHFFQRFKSGKLLS